MGGQVDRGLRVHHPIPCIAERIEPRVLHWEAAATARHDCSRSTEDLYQPEPQLRGSIHKGLGNKDRKDHVLFIIFSHKSSYILRFLIYARCNSFCIILFVWYRK